MSSCHLFSPWLLKILRELAAEAAKILHPDGHFHVSFMSLKKSRRVTADAEGVWIFAMTVSMAGRIRCSLEPWIKFERQLHQVRLQ